MYQIQSSNRIIKGRYTEKSRQCHHGKTGTINRLSSGVPVVRRHPGQFACSLSFNYRNPVLGNDQYRLSFITTFGQLSAF
ncbi:MAG: hypothetical protein WCF03_08885 [Nitrososphaeraceae archaeon]